MAAKKKSMKTTKCECGAVVVDGGERCPECALCRRMEHDAGWNVEREVEQRLKRLERYFEEARQKMLVAIEGRRSADSTAHLFVQYSETGAALDLMASCWERLPDETLIPSMELVLSTVARARDELLRGRYRPSSTSMMSNAVSIATADGLRLFIREVGDAVEWLDKRKQAREWCKSHGVEWTEC